MKRDDEARAALAALIEARREDYAGLSRLIGRNAAYIQQYIKRGTPKRLSEEDRRRLADYFGVDESLFGGMTSSAGPPLTTVPRIAVSASAGPGATPVDERVASEIGFDPQWLRKIVRTGDLSQLALLRVEGDSMQPMLADGDDILIDRADGPDRLRDGIYVLRMDDTLLVKRIGVKPGARTLSVLSDNTHYPSYDNVRRDDLEIIGRVVWAGRKVG